MSFSSRHNPQIQTQANTPEYSPREEIDGAHAKHHICNNNRTYSSSAIQQEEEDSEYTLTLKQALKTAMDENEILANRIMELEAMMATVQDELEQKDRAIIELADLLEIKVSKS